MSIDKGNPQPVDDNMDNSPPASGSMDDTAAVCSFLEESGVIPNGEAAIKLVDMWAYFWGRIMR